MSKIDLTPDLARSLQDYALLMGQSREYLLRRALLEYFEDLENRFLAQYPETGSSAGAVGERPATPDYWDYEEGDRRGRNERRL